jgi:hypothetical protein
MSGRPSVPSSHEHTLSVALTTTFALIDQFSTSVSGSTNRSSVLAREDHPRSMHSPLPLLSASAASLKAQSTKLSLLTLTPPFTPSAVSTVLSGLDSSVLPSLLTAGLLVINEEYKYTTSFSAEIRLLVKATLRDLHTLISHVEKRSKNGNPRAQLDEQQKNNVTEAVGRVWESCDELVALADGGIGAFVVKKAEMWLGLIKDAVEELGDWDPEEDGVDGLFGEDAQQEDNTGEETEEPSGAAEKAKVGSMKVLTRVPQSLHVVVKQRLRKWNWNWEKSTNLSNEKASDMGQASSPDHGDYGLRVQGATADDVLRGMQQVSETVDEMAEALYMGELTRSGRLLKDVWKATVEVVGAVRSSAQDHGRNGSRDGCAGGHLETSEDRYIQRAFDWINSVEPKPPSPHAVTNGPVQGITKG